ncbi:MAG: hypothetical protein KDA65_17360, partial [Planctomycetaceae bacterium]|nr:hypothetical protein [Planctomycetaceae bacterium]
MTNSSHTNDPEAQLDEALASAKGVAPLEQTEENNSESESSLKTDSPVQAELGRTEKTTEDDSQPITYSTGEKGTELDTVLRVPRTGSSVSIPEEIQTPNSTEQPIAGDDITPSEVRFRLFPREQGLPVDAPLPETAGLVLGHFRIEERIGTGGMGAVFRAIDERLQRVVALKVLSPTQLH